MEEEKAEGDASGGDDHRNASLQEDGKSIQKEMNSCGSGSGSGGGDGLHAKASHPPEPEPTKPTEANSATEADGETVDTVPEILPEVSVCSSIQDDENEKKTKTTPPTCPGVAVANTGDSKVSVSGSDRPANRRDDGDEITEIKTYQDQDVNLAVPSSKSDTIMDPADGDSGVQTATASFTVPVPATLFGSISSDSLEGAGGHDDVDAEAPPPPSGTLKESAADTSEDVEAARTRHNKYVASNLMEGYAFHTDCMSFLEAEYGEEMLLKMVANADDDTMSASFSGIEAPHTAACANRLALAKHLGIPPDQVPLPKLLHMIEWDSENQEELLLIARQTGACLFSDPRLSKQIVFDF